MSRVHRPRHPAVTPESFHKDVRNHKLTVILDGPDCHRHLRFKKPDSYDMHFDIVTWPGYLAFTGDMGTFVFTRLRDMLEFFRFEQSPEPLSSIPMTLRINVGYWGEKVVASDRHDGLTVYRPELFREEVQERVNRYIEEHELTEEETDELRAAVKDELLEAEGVDDSEYMAHKAASEFSHKISDEETFQLTDFFEVSLREASDRFLWCCYALSHAVQTYDIEKRRQAAAAKETGQEGA